MCQHCPLALSRSSKRAVLWAAGKSSSAPQLEGSPRLQEAHLRLGFHQYQEWECGKLMAELSPPGKLGRAPLATLSCPSLNDCSRPSPERAELSQGA